MKRCRNCEHMKDEVLMYLGTDWCNECVLATLDDQEKQAKDRKVRPQVFAT